MVHAKNNRVPKTFDWGVLLPRLWSIAEQIDAEKGTDVNAWAQRFHAAMRPAVTRILSAFGKTRKPHLLYSILLKLISNGLIENPFVQRACVNIANHYHDRVRDLETFVNTTRTPPRKQYALLLRHLFATYDDIPEFLDSVWLQGKGGSRYQKVFQHLGSGKNLKTAPLGFNITVTKKVAHHFRFAPRHYSIPEALRWAQIHALGGNKRLVEAIRGTRLVHTFTDDTFWVNFFRFLINSDSLESVSPRQIQMIVDWIWDIRFVPQRVLIAGGGERQVSPSQPHFSLKGKCLKTLLANAESWHHASDNKIVGFQWHPSEERVPFEITERDGTVTWKFRELLSTAELVSEGEALQHCVGEYDQACYEGRSKIWSLECDRGAGTESILTLEVVEEETITEIRGYGNRLPTPKESNIVRLWGLARGLDIDT